MVVVLTIGLWLAAQALEEEAHMVQTSEALDRHPLLAPPSRLAVVAPLLPSRVFIPTKVALVT